MFYLRFFNVFLPQIWSVLRHKKNIFELTSYTKSFASATFLNATNKLILHFTADQR